MLRSIIKPSFLLPTVYLFVSATNVHCRIAGKAQSVDLAPHLAFDQERRIKDVGITSRDTAATGGTSATYLNLFERLDTLAAQAEELSAFFLYLTYKTFFLNYGSLVMLTGILGRSRTILHCDQHLQTQLSRQDVDIMCAALKNAHIRSVYVWSGQPLTDHEITSGQLPGHHWRGKVPPWSIL
jgi:hypothetical protein